MNQKIREEAKCLYPEKTELREGDAVNVKQRLKQKAFINGASKSDKPNDLLLKIYKHITSTTIPTGSWEILIKIENHLKENELL